MVCCVAVGVGVASLEGKTSETSGTGVDVAVVDVSAATGAVVESVGAAGTSGGAVDAGAVGIAVGATVGFSVGSVVGSTVGAVVGSADGVFVSLISATAGDSELMTNCSWGAAEQVQRTIASPGFRYPVYAFKHNVGSAFTRMVLSFCHTSNCSLGAAEQVYSTMRSPDCNRPVSALKHNSGVDRGLMVLSALRTSNNSL